MLLLHHLQVFESIVKNRSVTKAAEELRSTQPAVSQILKALERRYGTLVRRDGHGVELTERGQGFHNDIEAILARVTALEHKHGDKAAAPETKPLIVGGSHGPASSVLPHVLHAFKKDHPSVAVELKAGASPAVQQLVLNAEVDLAVVTNPSPSTSLEMEPFREFQLCVFVAANHPLARRTEIQLGEFARYPLITGPVRQGLFQTNGPLSSMRAKGLKQNVWMRFEWPEAVKALVREGEGVGILYRDVVAQGVGDGIFKIIKVAGINLTVLSYIIYSKEKALSRHAQEFLTRLRATRPKLSLVRESTQTADS